MLRGVSAVNGQIFNQKSMKRITTPEELKDYIRVANPGIWMILSAVIILLIGVCVWGVFGRLDTDIKVTLAVDEKGAFCYVTTENFFKIHEGMSVVLDDTEICVLGKLPKTPVSADSIRNEYVLYVSDMEEELWLYEVPLVGDAPFGTYDARIVLERVSPISFIMN